MLGILPSQVTLLSEEGDLKYPRYQRTIMLDAKNVNTPIPTKVLVVNIPDTISGSCTGFLTGRISSTRGTEALAPGFNITFRRRLII